MTGAWLHYKQHKCKNCPKMAFGQSKYCLICKVDAIRNNANRFRERNERKK